jgi:hypothetical protein
MPKHFYEDEEQAQEVFEEEHGYDSRRVEQELQDEELARQLAKAEERALAAEERARGRAPARPWTMRRACSFMVPLVIIVVGTVALISAMSEESTAPSTAPIYRVPFFEGEDPWEGLKPTDVARWNNGGSGGLKLDVVDALQGPWEDIFHAVIKDWDEGTPKVLSLSTEKEGHDPECEPIDNKSKVCNGNYGDSQWRGINQVLIQNGYIVAATSKMNEFYLANADNAQKRYTLCHELGTCHITPLSHVRQGRISKYLTSFSIALLLLSLQKGHSFGLAHTDENFFNAPLGNCMDYTDNPAANESPDLSNFEFLEELYGTLPGRQRARWLEPERSDEKRIPDDIRAIWKEVVPVFENGEHHENKGWRLLKRSNQSEVHEISFGKGWVLRMTKLLVL